MHNATAITTGSANQRPNTPCIRLWIDVTFRGLEDSYRTTWTSMNTFSRTTRCLWNTNAPVHTKSKLPGHFEKVARGFGPFRIWPPEASAQRFRPFSSSAPIYEKCQFLPIFLFFSCNSYYPCFQGSKSRSLYTAIIKWDNPLPTTPTLISFGSIELIITM